MIKKIATVAVYVEDQQAAVTFWTVQFNRNLYVVDGFPMDTKDEASEQLHELIRNFKVSEK